MKEFLLSPLTAFCFFLLLGLFILWFFSRFSTVGKESPGKYESYACGQRDVQHNVSPDYNQFFPYAFFFTIMHVLALVISTAPKDALLLPLICIAAGLLSLVIIFRGEEND
jgi:NADH-quinone oxidoreductase subunit A